MTESTEEKVGVELPIKKTTGDTLKERMDSNAYERILPARYQMKNENGELVEEQEDVFKRVAKNLALAEALYESERQNETVHVTPTQVKDNHNKREKLVESVFGERLPPEKAESEGFEEELTEENVKYFSYNNVVPELSSDVKEHVEQVQEKFQEHMENLKWTPNTPTIINAGDSLQMLAACFVNSPDDSMESIHQTAKEASMIFKGGGGIGYGIWKLRPKGDEVGTTGGKSSGPISFLRTYDTVCGTVEAGGVRRGAQMAVMRVSHPDVLEFIHSKDKDVSLAHELSLNDPDDFTHTKFREALQEARDLLDNYGGVPEHLRNAVEGHLSNFNISVGVTDDFMECVKNNETYTFTNPKTNEPFVANEETVETYEMFGLGDHIEEGEVLEVPANLIWEHVIQGAHENGEPGVVYLERMNKRSSFDVEKHPEKRIHSTNPCAEESLYEADACNLSHINLSTILDEECAVQDYGKFSDSYENENVEEIVDEYLEQVVDWDELNERIHYNTRFLDNVVTMCDYPIPKIEETTRKGRKIGLGIMGYAQMLIQMGVAYGSEEGNEIARQVMNYINDETTVVSRRLAVSDNPGMNRGVFEEWHKSKWSNPEEYKEWFEHEFTRDDAEEWMDGFPVRNHTLTTLAPTGTTSRLGNTTGGCEPMYSVANFSNVSDDIQGEDMLVDFDDMFLRVLEANDINIEDVKEEATEQMNNNTFNGVEGLETVPERLNNLFVTTQDLGPIEHASVQCAFQEGIGSAISKTVNAPNDSTMEDARRAFEYVYDNGGKGVTYYRDGSRSKQVLTTRKDNKEMADDESPEELVANMVNSGELEVEELVDTLQSEADMRLVEDNETLSISEYRRRPDMLPGMNIRVTTGYGTLYVWISEDVNGDMFEVFAQVGKSGGSTQSLTEALGRMISMSLRYGVPPQRIVKHLRGIKSSRVGYENGETIESIADGIAYAMNLYNENEGVVGILSEVREHPDGKLAEMIVGDEPPADMNLEAKRQMVDNAVTGESVSVSENGSSVGADETDTDSDKEQLDAAELIQRGEEPACPDCGEENLYYSEGCKTCENCGWSKC